MTYSDLIDAVQPIPMGEVDDSLFRYIALAEQEIYRACGLRPQGKPRLTLVRGGRYGESVHAQCREQEKP